LRSIWLHGYGRGGAMTNEQMLATVQNELELAKKALHEMIADGEFLDKQRRTEKTQYACGQVDGLAALERKVRNLIEKESP
jgi:hypothetical protein